MLPRDTTQTRYNPGSSSKSWNSMIPVRKSNTKIWRANRIHLGKLKIKATWRNAFVKFIQPTYIRAFIIRLLGSLVSRFAFLLFPLGMGKTKTRTQNCKTNKKSQHIGNVKVSQLVTTKGKNSKP